MERRAISPPLLQKNGEYPIVFQCENCRTIVGDSTYLISTNNALKIVTLGVVTSDVRVKDKLISSSNSEDLGSSYNPLVCESCNTDLGRIYRTTTFLLDDLRGRYSLYLERLTCYRVGSGELTSVESPSLKTLQQNILRLQAVSVSLNTRVLELEERLSEAIIS